MRKRSPEAMLDKSKTIHRFTELAQKTAADLWAGVRVTLDAMRHESAKAWPAAKLLNYLKGAEELVREALIVVAEKLNVIPVTVRERSIPADPPKPGGPRGPLFRLGIAVTVAEEESESTLGRSPERGPCEAQSADTGSNKTAGPAPSIYDKRLAALEDVLTDPGRHAARMARALYRRENDITGGRLNLKDDDGLMLDQVNTLMDALITGDADTFDTLRGDIPFLDSS